VKKLIPLHIYDAPLHKGFLLKLGNVGWAQETIVRGYLDEKKFDNIFSRLDIYTQKRVRQRDGQTPADGIVSRGKICECGSEN